MRKRDRPAIGCAMALTSALMAGLLVWLALLLLSGCTPTRYVETERTRDRWHTLTHTDTLMVRDSIVIDRSGDTIKEERWRDRWHKVTVRDTLKLTDSIPYAVEVERELTPWQRTKLDLGGYALALLAVMTLYITIRIFRKIHI